MRCIKHNLIVQHELFKESTRFIKTGRFMRGEYIFYYIKNECFARVAESVYAGDLKSPSDFTVNCGFESHHGYYELFQ